METDLYMIERYFEGSLSPEERANFEKKRKDDQSFDKEIKLYVQSLDVIRSAARLRMKSHLDSLAQREGAISAVETFIRYRLLKRQWVAIAATVLFLLGGFFFVRQVFFQSVTDLPELFQQYYSVPSTDLMSLRSSGENRKIENAATLHYSEKQYDKAATEFNMLLNDLSYTRRSTASFYLGICYINMNKPDSAILSFDKVSLTSTFGNSAQWFKGMAFLQKGDKNKAVTIFTQIRNSDEHPYRKEAVKISRALSSIK